MANVHMAFILTDSAQRYFDKDDKEAVEVVKIANISPDDMSEKPHRGDLTLQGFEVDRTVAGITIMGNYARPTSANSWDKHLQELHCVVFALHNQSGQKQQVQNQYSTLLLISHQ